MDGSRGLYWRRHGALRYYATRRVNKFGLGNYVSAFDRLKREWLTAGR